MAEIVNLRRARKARKRAEEAGKAEENRVRFGLSKAAKAQQQIGKSRVDRLLDGARLERE